MVIQQIETASSTAVQESVITYEYVVGKRPGGQPALETQKYYAKCCSLIREHTTLYTVLE